jgi:hypothetical protein
VIAALLLSGAALQLPLPPCADPLVLVVPSSWYVSLIARYRGGSREAAVSESIPSERFRGEIMALGNLLGYHRGHRNCPVPNYLVAVTREETVTQSGVVRAGRRQTLDPWWRYMAGQTEDSDGLDQLRAEVSR